MFYQDALPEFPFLSSVDSLLTIEDTLAESSHYVQKAESANLLSLARNWCLFMWGAYFCMGAYQRDVVVLIKMGAYIHAYFVWVLIPILRYVLNYHRNPW